MSGVVYPAGEFEVRRYSPPGPVGAAFLQDRSPVRGIMGPIGSGKTNCCIFDALTCATQMPVCIDGVKRWSGLVFRPTYAELWDTVIKSWWQWFPDTVGKWSGVKGRQATHALTFDQQDGSQLKFLMDFRALGDTMSIEDALKGIEPSWAWLNEMDTLDEDVLTYVLGRVKQQRYPPQRLLPPSAFTVDANGERKPKYFSGVIGDFNPPDTDNYTYKLFEEDPLPGYKLFKQPSGRSPRGENRAGVSRSSYDELAALNAHRAWWVKRMIDGQFGPSRDGQPVYEHYDDDRHCADELKADPHRPLRLAFDQGVTGPAMLVYQPNFIGQILVLDELAPGHRMGPTMFAQRCRAFLLARYGGFRIEHGVCDMAGFAGGDKEEGDHAWADIVARVLDIIMVPAPTNEIQARIDGVSQLLEYFPGARPALVISKRCAGLRKGFNSHYRYIIDKNDRAPHPVPQKNHEANLHDALQYAVLDTFGLEGVLAGVPGGERGRGLKGAGRPVDDDDEDDMPPPGVVVRSDFDVFKV